MSVVGPASCTHCSRAIWLRLTALGERWVHANGSAHCYSPSGDKLDAAPRETTKETR